MPDEMKELSKLMKENNEYLKQINKNISIVLKLAAGKKIVENEPNTVKIQFLPNKIIGNKYAGDGLYLQVWDGKSKIRKDTAIVKASKASQLMRDYPDCFKVIDGKKDIQDYENMMFDSYKTK